MTLTLTLTNVAELENGESVQLRLDRRGAVIGRSPHSDWSLPDPKNYVSSTHCEIDYRGGDYLLIDKSTNGTFLNGAERRMSGPHVLRDGDVIGIGHYRVGVSHGAGRIESAATAPAQEAKAGWATPADAGASSAASGWAPPAGAAPSHWEARPAPMSAPADSVWGQAGAGWTGGSAAVDVWGATAASNAVDWSRGGFGGPAPGRAAPGPESTADSQAWGALLAAAGVAPDALHTPPEKAATTAGALLKRLVSGLVVMMEARARARAQLGAQSTTLELRGNNPIKFARSPERVLAQLLNPPERGFMGAADAVEDSFRDLQAHQMATLAAMQGALRATLDRFSPEAIRKRAEMRGVLARILPGARNATLWEAYEREFEGVAKGSDEAFMDVFAKAFRAAYEQAASQMKTPAGQ